MLQGIEELDAGIEAAWKALNAEAGVECGNEVTTGQPGEESTPNERSPSESPKDRRDSDST